MFPFNVLAQSGDLRLSVRPGALSRCQVKRLVLTITDAEGNASKIVSAPAATVSWKAPAASAGSGSIGVSQLVSAKVVDYARARR
jgi:hypothetical protein